MPLGNVFSTRNLAHAGLAGLSAILLIALFPPVELAPLAVVALVPWLIMVTRATTRAQLVISYLAGLLFFFLGDTWILPITVPGYVSMSLFVGLYWPLAGFLIQRLTRRWNVPLFLAAPLGWTACEYIRSVGPLGFPWFFLGHSQATYLPVIQIADLAGVYGVSFILAMTNGAIVEMIDGLKSRRLSRIVPRAAVVAVVWAAALGYGIWRLGQNTTRPGPVLAVVQEDFPMYVNRDVADSDVMLKGFLDVSLEAAAQHPDLIIWPETCIGVPINPEFLNATELTDKHSTRGEQRYGRDVADLLGEHARLAGSDLIVGSISRRFNPPGHNPPVDKYNSAIIFDRRGKYVDRYDKIRLVLFGEVVPFRYTWPRLYRFLNENMTPYGKGGFEYSLTAGREDVPKRFTLSTPAEDFRYAIAICYEDTMADLIAKFARPDDGRKPIDFLVNISNDGWFDHSCELLQHFYICVFRAVENRLAVARSVNTGISGIIDPNGRIAGMVRDGSRICGPGIRGALTRQINVDSRITLYSRIGNAPIFVVTLLVVVSATVLPLFLRPREAKK